MIRQSILRFAVDLRTKHHERRRHLFIFSVLFVLFPRFISLDCCLVLSSSLFQAF